MQSGQNEEGRNEGNEGNANEERNNHNKEEEIGRVGQLGRDLQSPGTRDDGSLVPNDHARNQAAHTLAPTAGHSPQRPHSSWHRPAVPRAAAPARPTLGHHHQGQAGPAVQGPSHPCRAPGDGRARDFHAKPPSKLDDEGAGKGCPWRTTSRSRSRSRSWPAGSQAWSATCASSATDAASGQEDESQDSAYKVGGHGGSKRLHSWLGPIMGILVAGCTPATTQKVECIIPAVWPDQRALMEELTETWLQACDRCSFVVSPSPEAVQLAVKIAGNRAGTAREELKRVRKGGSQREQEEQRGREHEAGEPSAAEAEAEEEARILAATADEVARAAAGEGPTAPRTLPFRTWRTFTQSGEAPPGNQESLVHGSHSGDDKSQDSDPYASFYKDSSDQSSNLVANHSALPLSIGHCRLVVATMLAPDGGQVYDDPLRFATIRTKLEATLHFGLTQQSSAFAWTCFMHSDVFFLVENFRRQLGRLPMDVEEAQDPVVLGPSFSETPDPQSAGLFGGTCFNRGASAVYSRAWAQGTLSSQCASSASLEACLNSIGLTPLQESWLRDSRGHPLWFPSRALNESWTVPVARPIAFHGHTTHSNALAGCTVGHRQGRKRAALLGNPSHREMFEIFRNTSGVLPRNVAAALARARARLNPFFARQEASGETAPLWRRRMEHTERHLEPNSDTCRCHSWDGSPMLAAIQSAWPRQVRPWGRQQYHFEEPLDVPWLGRTSRDRLHHCLALLIDLQQPDFAPNSIRSFSKRTFGMQGLGDRKLSRCFPLLSALCLLCAASLQADYLLFDGRPDEQTDLFDYAQVSILVGMTGVFRCVGRRSPHALFSAFEARYNFAVWAETFRRSDFSLFQWTKLDWRVERYFLAETCREKEEDERIEAVQPSPESPSIECVIPAAWPEERLVMEEIASTWARECDRCVFVVAVRPSLPPAPSRLGACSVVDIADGPLVDDPQTYGANSAKLQATLFHGLTNSVEDWVCFVDADVYFAAPNFRRLAARRDLLSTQIHWVGFVYNSLLLSEGQMVEPFIGSCFSREAALKFRTSGPLFDTGVQKGVKRWPPELRSCFKFPVPHATGYTLSVANSCLRRVGIFPSDVALTHDGRGRQLWYNFHPLSSLLPETDEAQPPVQLFHLEADQQRNQSRHLWFGKEYLYTMCKNARWEPYYPVAFHGHTTEDPAYYEGMAASLKSRKKRWLRSMPSIRAVHDYFVRHNFRLEDDYREALPGLGSTTPERLEAAEVAEAAAAQRGG